jgi:hypothetical protein
MLPYDKLTDCSLVRSSGASVTDVFIYISKCHNYNIKVSVIIMYKPRTKFKNVRKILTIMWSRPDLLFFAPTKSIIRKVAVPSVYNIRRDELRIGLLFKISFTTVKDSHGFPMSLNSIDWRWNVHPLRTVFISLLSIFIGKYLLVFIIFFCNFIQWHYWPWCQFVINLWILSPSATYFPMAITDSTSDYRHWWTTAGNHIYVSVAHDCTWKCLDSPHWHIPFPLGPRLLAKVPYINIKAFCNNVC